MVPHCDSEHHKETAHPCEKFIRQRGGGNRGEWYRCGGRFDIECTRLVRVLTLLEDT